MGEHEVAAVFLDRDGVINRTFVREGSPYAPTSVAEFEIVAEADEACQRLKAAGFLLVVATNQPEVARGGIAREEVEEMHAQISKRLPIDRIEVCYDSGETASEFRKPAPGMLLRAAREMGIDLTRSFMVGDRWRDIECGHAAGCTTILIDRGYREELRERPDHSVKSLLEAAEVIIAVAGRTG